jgi:hypothetical protein
VALDTYIGLQGEIADWLDREDLTSKIPTFIRLFEAQAERKLRLRQMLVTNEQGLTPLTGRIVLPDNFLALHNLSILDPTGNPLPITYAAKHQVDQRRTDLVIAGRPRVYTLSKNFIELAPLPDVEYTYEVSYWERLPKLSDAVTSNWLLLDHPDLYLYGSLMQAEPYLKHDERVSLWGTALDTLLDDLTLADERAMRGGNPLKLRLGRAYG